LLIQEFDIKEHTEKIANLFNIDLHFKEDIKDYALFIDNMNSTCISLIDLSSKEKSSIPVETDYLGNHSAICKIEANSYFIYGGIRTNTPIGSAMIINTEQNSFKALPSSNPNYFAGCCYFDHKCYIFGGRTSNDYPAVKTSQAFDLVKYRWCEISNLPHPCSFTTTSVIDKKILITGSGMGLIQAYNPINDGYLDYYKNLRDSASVFLFENWLVNSNKNLYEIVDGIPEWRGLHDWDKTNLSIFGSFKREHFIYFIGIGKELYRIDTNQKKLVRVYY
jgi:hypothetical protein